MKTLNRLIIISITVGLFSSCSPLRNYKAITTKPENFYSDAIYSPDTSLLSLDLAVDFKEIENKVNSLFSKPYSDKGSDEFDKKYQAKTQNSAYDPNEWIKTKDPLYHPRKWIKTKIFGKTIKTKDPLFHPNKWIKIKNPKYNPNKWIYVNTVRVQVGYTYEYTITKRKDIKFVNVGDNILRIIVPLDIEGAIGFKGDGAKLFSLTRKNIEGKIDFYIDTDISFQSDWCPNINTDINHKWVSDPKIEVADGVWLNLKLPADLQLKSKEKEIEKEISDKIDCEKLREQIKQWVKPSSTELEDFSEKLYLNINPSQFYLSNLYVDKSTLNLKFGSKVLMNVSTEKEFSDTKNHQIPELRKYSFDKNLITLTVPIKIQYSVLNDTLNDFIKADSLNFETKGVQVKIKKFEIYPSGEALTIGINLSARFPGKILSTMGTVYMTAQPNITNDRFFELQNFAFSTELDNELYPILGSLFAEKITSIIQTKTRRDLKPQFSKAEKLIETRISEKLKTVNNIDVQTDKVVFDISSVHIRKDEVIVPVRIASGVKMKVKNVW